MNEISVNNGNTMNRSMSIAVKTSLLSGILALVMLVVAGIAIIRNEQGMIAEIQETNIRIASANLDVLQEKELAQLQEDVEFDLYCANWSLSP